MFCDEESEGNIEVLTDSQCEQQVVEEREAAVGGSVRNCINEHTEYLGDHVPHGRQCGLWVGLVK